MMPIHADLLEYWKNNEETDPVKKALRFLFMSNFGYMGKQDSIHFTNKPSKKKFPELLESCFDFLNEEDVKFNNCHYKRFFKCITFVNGIEIDIDKAFIYADPPYIRTTDNYSNSFTESDSNDLFDCLEETKCKFAMSEFEHPFILDQAKKRGLNVITIGERQNLKNRRTEILVTNYRNQQKELF
jgi:DNA adenine methylase